MRSDCHNMDVSFRIDGLNAFENSKDSLHHHNIDVSCVDRQSFMPIPTSVVEAIMAVILRAGLEESLHFIANLNFVMSALGMFSKSISVVCVCVCLVGVCV